jgi:hypothetical protein
MAAIRLPYSSTPLWQQGDAYIDAWARRGGQDECVGLHYCRKRPLMGQGIANDSYPVQAQAQSISHYDPDSRIQRRDCHIQERKVQRLGGSMRRWQPA